MHHIRGVPRQQTMLLPLTIEQYIPVDHPVRVVDAFVEGLHLEGLGFERATPETTGRPPYHPGDLMKLYLYGYLNRIRSSRSLERECARNLEVIWLLGDLRPDFKTIANFRKENSEAIRGVCRSLVLFCRQQGLVGGEVVGIDGSKFEAATSRKRAFTMGKVHRSMAEIDAKIEHYLKELDQNDVAEQPATSSASVEQALSALREQKQHLQAMAEEMVRNEGKQVVEGEPEARIMGQGAAVVGYNVQTAIDAKHKLIVHHEVVNEANDRRQLFPMASGAKSALEAETLQVLADAGYHNAEQSRQCEQERIEPVVPAQMTRNQHAKYFPREAFIYDSDTDSYHCPAGAVMKRARKMTSDNRHMYRTSACRSCPLRPQCTSSSRRMITRSPDEDAALRADERARESGAMSRRSGLVEHPFAWLKRTLGGRFLSRGMRNVKAEIALAITAYNVRRLLSILGAPRVLQLLPA